MGISMCSPSQAAAKSPYQVFLEDVELLTKPLSEVIATLAVVFAALQYRQSVRTKHAEWLLSLFKSFYETSKYQRIRLLADSPESPEFLQLESDIKELRTSPDLQSLDRYLNFFEFVAVLWRSGQVTRGEVCDLFEYYLGNLKRSPSITRYIDHQGFERLHQLLATIKPK
jgi:hypothetical protein